MIGGDEEHDEYSARVIEPHPLFGNNFDLINLPKRGLVHQSVEKARLRGDQSTFDVVFYLAAKLFKVSKFYLQLVYGLGILFKKSFDHMVDYCIQTKLSAVLGCNRIAYLVNLLSSSLFHPKVEHSEQDDEATKKHRKEQAYENFQAFLRPYIQPLCGSSYTYEEGTQFVLDILQDPVMNKQLCYILLDVILDELFPEIIVKRSK